MTVTEPEQHTRPAGAPVYPDFEFDAAGSPSRYRHYQSGRGVNYYTADPDLQASLNTYLDPTTRGWAEDVLTDLGERAGTELARRADVYDAAGHELVRYDRFGRDISRVDHHPDWLSSLNEVFDFGLVGWNHDPALLARYGRAPVTLLTAFDYLVGQADMALCCPLELAHGTVVVLEQFGTDEQRARFLPGVVATDTGAGSRSRRSPPRSPAAAMSALPAPARCAPRSAGGS